MSEQSSSEKINVMKKSKETDGEDKAEADAKEGAAQSDAKEKAVSDASFSQSELDWIVEHLADHVVLEDTPEMFGESSKPTKVLSTQGLDRIVEYINKVGSPKIITMAGAGISTSAGIPDFRSPSEGLYDNLGKYNLPYPQAIFELDFFTENPEPFFVLAKDLLPEKYNPQPSHYFIRLLWEKGLLLRHYTQNVDGLERAAGLPAEKLVEAHGSFHTGRCLKCGAPYAFDWMKEKIIEDTIPKCEECKEGTVKPDIVFFGEMLSERFHTLVDQDFPRADLLIIMGSSLVVQPFAFLVDRVKSTCPRLLINKEKVVLQDALARFFGLEFSFGPKNSRILRDVAWIGDCDTGCMLLANKLGWGDELKAMIGK